MNDASAASGTNFCPFAATASSMTITVQAKGFGADRLFAHIDRNGWKQAVDVGSILLKTGRGGV